MSVISGAPSSKQRIALAVLVACAALLQSGAMTAAPVAVRHTEGLVHGFLVLRTLAGDTRADGDLIQVARGESPQFSVLPLSVRQRKTVDSL